MTRHRPPVRVLIIPGLRDSGPTHWQTWLQGQYAHATRVQQADWDAPDLDRWSTRIAETLARHGAHTDWVAVAHSFGTLALAHHLSQVMQAELPSAHGGANGVGPRHGRIVAALMVAPAEPRKFGIEERLPRRALGMPMTLVGSEDDPWMSLERARWWAHTWGAGFRNLGPAGHVNSESGFGPWPLARQKVDALIRRHALARPSPCDVGDDRGDADGAWLMRPNALPACPGFAPSGTSA